MCKIPPSAKMSTCTGYMYVYFLDLNSSVLKLLQFIKRGINGRSDRPTALKFMDMLHKKHKSMKIREFYNILDTCRKMRGVAVLQDKMEGRFFNCMYWLNCRGKKMYAIQAHGYTRTLYMHISIEGLR